MQARDVCKPCHELQETILHCFSDSKKPPHITRRAECKMCVLTEWKAGVLFEIAKQIFPKRMKNAKSNNILFKRRTSPGTKTHYFEPRASKPVWKRSTKTYTGFKKTQRHASKRPAFFHKWKKNYEWNKANICVASSNAGILAHDAENADTLNSNSITVSEEDRCMWWKGTLD